MRKVLFFILIFSALAHAQQQRLCEDSFGVDVICREEIQSTGIERLSDLFALINTSIGSTLGGYREQININALNPGWEQNWSLMIDGQKMDLDFPYAKNINLIPISVNEIDYVEVITMPGVSDGEFTGDGLIHIHTLKAKDGFSLRASLATANETGDPGPWKYENHDAPNIDQVGPYYWASINYGSENFNARLGFKHHLHIYTDPRFNYRIIDFPWEYKELRMTGASLKIDADILNGKHTFFAGRTVTGDPVLFNGYGPDLVFFKPFGKEIPAETKLFHAGLNGEFLVGSETAFKYSMKYSSGKMDWTSDLNQKLFDWEMNRINGAIGIESTDENIPAGLSAGFNRVEFNTGYRLRKDNYTLIKINGRIGLMQGDKLKPAVYGGAVFCNDKSSFKMGAKLTFVANKDVSINTNISYSTRLPEENNSMWYWMENGYDFLNKYGMNYTVEGDLKTSRNLTADLDFRFSIEDRFKLTVGGFYRKFNDFYLERQNYTYKPDSVAFAATTYLTNSQHGTIAGFRFDADHQISSKVNYQIYYQYVPQYKGSDLFFEGWQSMPEHKFKCAIRYKPVLSLSFAADFTFLSDTYWLEYSGVDQASGGLYNHVLDGNLLLNFAVQKMLWDNRLRVSLALNNILSDVIVYHPVGGMFDMTFLMQVELLL